MELSVPFVLLQGKEALNPVIHEKLAGLSLPVRGSLSSDRSDLPVKDRSLQFVSSKSDLVMDISLHEIKF